MRNITVYFRIIKRIGIVTTCKTLIKKYSKQKSKNYLKYKTNFENKNGLEIGGPSAIFSNKGFWPIYTICKNLNNCNYKSSTTWEKNKKGKTFEYLKNKKGIQYISEATDLQEIKNESYDFLINSHLLEHIANPLKAIGEWKRVLKKDGTLLIIVPEKSKIFDHKRKITKFSHILTDYKKNIDETDLTHLNEILQKHDFYGDEIKTKTELTKRCQNNFENRNMHHHVFDEKLLKQILKYHNFQILTTTIELPYNIIILAKKK
jgi:SAM-dependent methyltransferase